MLLEANGFSTCAPAEANLRPWGTPAGDEPRAGQEMGQRLAAVDTAPAAFVAERRRGEGKAARGPGRGHGSVTP